jgi:hypothetical protein
MGLCDGPASNFSDIIVISGGALQAHLVGVASHDILRCRDSEWVAAANLYVSSPTKCACATAAGIIQSAAHYRAIRRVIICEQSVRIFVRAARPH